MTDTETATPAAGAAPAPQGIIAREAEAARAAIAAAVADLGLTPRGPIDLRPLPFAGTWGVASSVAHSLAGERAMRRLQESGALDGLSKKEAKQAAAAATREIAQELAAEVATRVGAANGYAAVEAVNGFVNVSFDALSVAEQLTAAVLTEGDAYGHGPDRPERIMVEHSQPNTHKAVHVGHLRNTCLGIAVSNILAAAGYPVIQASYPGDMGMHVIKCLWCYESFHDGQEPTDPLERARWLAGVYAEADARYRYRTDVVAFLQLLAREDKQLSLAIDRVMKYLWRAGAEGEDVAYLLGRMVQPSQEVKPDMLRDPGVILTLWPILGEQLREQLANPQTFTPEANDPEPTTTPEERYATWQELNAHLDWWLPSATWQDEVRATFQRWETQDPAFVALWKRTREWSLIDFERIFAELGAHIDVWFFESEVEAAGRAIVEELLAKGIAEVSDGLPVVKIDEKLGLETETYRTLPILRSDGTTLYSTKDLALTKRKFEEFGVDRAIWVVDVRQSLYFQQVFKVLELWGFDQARDAYHLSYEMVALPEGVISSRKGNAPLYDDVKDMVLARAAEVIAEKNPDMPAERRAVIATQVGIGSLKYAMLARDNNKMVIFDLDEALSFDGHAAPYIQYAHARACRILEHARTTGSREQGARSKDDVLVDSTVDAEAVTVGQAVEDDASPLPAPRSSLPGALAPEELSLLQQIAQLPEEVQRAAEQYRPLLIANYVYDLARAFNDFYHACPVLSSPEPTRARRLRLVDATRQTLANGLGLLGIAAPTAM